MMSYFYLNDESDRLRKAADRGLTMVVDSGAHTWQADHLYSDEATTGNYSSRERDTKTNVEKADEYFQEYIDWVKRHWQSIHRFVELDIGAIVSREVVDRWYETIEREGMADKCVRVFHADHWTREDWRAEVDRAARTSGWIGTEGPERAGVDLMPLLKYAHEQGVKVHAFGSSGRTLRDYPFFSCDSTTYKMGAQFGIYHYFDARDGRLRHGHWDNPDDHVGDVSVERAFRETMLRQEGREVQTKDRKIQRHARFEHSLREFLKYERFLTRLWRKRGIRWEEDPIALSHDPDPAVYDFTDRS
jgi:hypothetical protein